MSSVYDPFSPQFLADPYPNYHWLRAYHPVFRNEVAPEREWLLTQYADVAAALRDPRLSSRVIPSALIDQFAASGQPLLTGLARLFVHMLILQDDPHHARLRSLVSKAFTPRAVERVRERIEGIADALLDQGARRGKLELIEDFAAPLAVGSIAALLGLPSAEDVPLKRWSDDIVSLLDRNTKVDGLQRAATSAADMAAWVRGLIDERRAAPGGDLVSGLIAAREREDALDENELVSTCVLLLAAGHQTTMHGIGNATLALLRQPEAQAALRAEPLLTGRAVEELVRYDSPLQRIWRTAHTDLEIGGERIHAGDDVVLVLGAANRDPAVFREPDRLDFGPSQNPHLGFGYGTHFCLGAAFARLEMRVALTRLLARLPALKLATNDLEWRPGSMLRGLRALPLRL